MKLINDAKKPTKHLTAFGNILPGWCFWYDDGLHIKLDTMMTVQGHKRNYLNLETTKTGYIDPSCAVRVEPISDVRVHFTRH